MHSKILIVLGSCIVGAASAMADDAAPRFARDVQPLLKRHCIKCHGLAKREAALNLSSPGGILRGGKTGASIVPHDADASLLWQRVADDEMPPDEPLLDKDKDVLKRWIIAGAPGLPSRETAIAEVDGKDHWAFQPLRDVKIPPVRDESRVRTEIDRFIQAALEEEKLSIGPEADRRTLIRRVSFDLTGLPPAPEEVAAFLDDHGDGACERMVERYLASPHYGERWGKYWLDSVGYADSNGYFNADSDRPLAYRYRDWVVRALNRDQPFDHFVRAQLAGDELAGFVPGHDASPETIEFFEATHYLRNGQDGSGESDGNPDEVRADRYYALESVIQNVTNSLFGLTIQCAKCHDHKFEPIAQRDYYQMQAIFAPAFNLEQWIKPNDRFVFASLPGEFAKWEVDVKSLDAELAVGRRELAAWIRANRPRGEVLFSDDFEMPSDRLGERWSNTAPGDNSPGGNVPVNIGASAAPGLVMSDGRLRIVEGNTQGDSWVSTREKFDWAPEAVGAAVQVTFDLVADRLDDAGRHAERIGYFVALHDFNDDSATAGGNLLIDGHPGGPTAVDLDYPGVDARRLGEIGAAGYKPGRNYGVRVTRVVNDQFKLEHLVDFFPDGKSLLLAKADLPEGGFGFEYCCGRSFEVDNVLIERFPGPADSTVHDEFRKVHDARRQPLDEMQKRRAALEERPGKIAWVADVSATAPDVFLLERGDYGKPSVKVEPAGLAVLSDDGHPYAIEPRSDPAKSTGRRLAFARWATATGSPREALLARVQVNRLWQHRFGMGIVATPENLGVTGAAPSHPQLLDWLAREFVEAPAALRQGGPGGAVGRENANCKLENGAWSLKRIHRLILNSAVYRQVARDDERAGRIDPDNRLLWRFPMRRLDAEAIRDALLAVSGDLDTSVGGPALSTKRTEAGEVVAEPSSGGALRRSIYLKQKRTQVVSFLAVFDAPSIVFNSIQRPSSTMPLQALAVLNSDLALDRSRSFAARLARDANDDAERLRLAYLAACSRLPDENELQTARKFIDSQIAEYQAQPDARLRAWADFCQMLLASNEFLYIE